MRHVATQIYFGCSSLVPDLMRSAIPFRSKLSSSGCLAAAYKLAIDECRFRGAAQPAAHELSMNIAANLTGVEQEDPTVEVKAYSPQV